MIPLFLAQSSPLPPSIWDMMTAIGVVVGVMVNLFVLLRMATGQDNKRQVEPTEMHGIVTELRSQTATLNKLDREMGETKASIKAVDDKITTQGEHVGNAFLRINAISVESAALKGRVDDLVSREGRRHA